jgi:23S rRNA (adenine2503-C2)-methyltransferase
MGMGEPMDNLDAVLAALEVLSSDWGYGLSPRRITVSTVGVLPQMERFLERSDTRLAVSLHSPFERERRRLMPVERANPLREVLDTIRRHTARPARSGRRVSFEYILFDGLNDSPRHVRELVRILHGIRARVNLIPFHTIPGVTMKGSSPETMERFRRDLVDRGIVATIRKSRGQDVSAACGLLSTLELVRNPP